MTVSTDLQRLARVRRQQQVERFRRRDQDVGRLALEPRALGGGRVARADRHRRRVKRVAARRGAVRDARRSAPAGCARRRPPAPSAARRRGRGTAACRGSRRTRVEHHPVDRPEKGGQRLAAAGRREDQRGFAARDRRPALRSAAASAPRNEARNQSATARGRDLIRRRVSPRFYSLSILSFCLLPLTPVFLRDGRFGRGTGRRRSEDSGAHGRA